MDTGQSEETFAQALAALMAEHGASQSDVARKIDGSPSAVSFWLSGQKTPRDKTIAKLAEAFPDSARWKQRLSDAAGRKVPAPLDEDRKVRIMKILDRMTKDQQEMFELQAKAVADSNGQQA